MEVFNIREMLRRILTVKATADQMRSTVLEVLPSSPARWRDTTRATIVTRCL